MIHGLPLKSNLIKRSTIVDDILISQQELLNTNSRAGYDCLKSIGIHERINNMGYKDMFATAEKEDKVKAMTYQNYKFEKKGQNLIGELVAIQPAHFEATNSSVNKYILKTDDGMFSAILGAIGDAQLDGRVNDGDILSITFIEKKNLTGGRTANIFDIKSIPCEVESGEETNDTTTAN